VNKSLYRGNLIVWINDEWVYSDTKEPTAVVSGGKIRPCGFCGKSSQSSEPDPCLGMLPGVLNACCGHGNPSEAYVCFENGVRLAGFTLTKENDMENHREIDDKIVERVAQMCYWESLSEDEKDDIITQVKKYIADPKAPDLNEGVRHICTVYLARYWNMHNDLEKMNQKVLS